MVRYHNTAQSAHDIIRMIAKGRPIVMQIQRELDEHKDIAGTAVGEAINLEFNEQVGRRQAELESVREEMMQTLRENDEETRQELEGKTRKPREQMERVRKDGEGMTSNDIVERKRLRAKLRHGGGSQKGEAAGRG